jgi:hypothetical protein
MRNDKGQMAKSRRADGQPGSGCGNKRGSRAGAEIAEGTAVGPRDAKCRGADGYSKGTGLIGRITSGGGECLENGLLSGHAGTAAGEPEGVFQFMVNSSNRVLGMCQLGSG